MLMSMITFGLVAVVVTGMYYLTESNGIFIGGRVSRYWIETFTGVFLGLVVKWIKFLLTLFCSYAGRLKLSGWNQWMIWQHEVIHARSLCSKSQPDYVDMSTTTSSVSCFGLCCDFYHAHLCFIPNMHYSHSMGMANECEDEAGVVV